MSDVYSESLELHAASGGKLEIKSKVPLANRSDLSLAYTPGVAAVCREIARDNSSAARLTCKGNMVAVISDGSAILGLGNLGPEAALPVMEGKCVLFKEFAGVDAFPICLDTQDVEEIIKTVKYLAPVFPMRLIFLLETPLPSLLRSNSYSKRPNRNGIAPKASVNGLKRR